MSGVEHSVELQNCYATLQVDRTAAIDEVKAAYRRLARLYHPDLNPGNPAATERFQLVNAAYETLSNHLLVSTYGVRSSPSAPKQTSRDRSDWEKNEAYTRFVDVLFGNLKGSR